MQPLIIPRQSAPITKSAPSFADLPTLDSQNLFALTKEIRITHGGEEYRLRLTRNNRLILTK